ncbi:MAG: L-serine ammonia-lyase, iron-sulfur-dependent, subunit alpha, partial [Clostridiaceae bacterium]|nr:L-serine ammonia-lyase, iron-sulfur-dependent, subunit alpha [Clostridiaceae bacterium]
MTKDDAVLLDILKREIIPATGCTEPVAVAYSTATARKKISGEVVNVEIYVDPGIYKNGMGVGIPGIKERGLEIAGALGLVSGKVEKSLQVIDDISPEQLEKAKELVSTGKIQVHIKKDCPRLYVETLLHTENGTVRVITMDRHLNIMVVDNGQQPFSSDCQNKETGKKAHPIQSYSLEDLILFSDTISIEEVSFLEKGVAMNLALAKEGLDIPKGIGKTMKQLLKDGLMSDNMIYNAKLLCSSAAEARMSGSKLSAMSSAGSGNHGITVFLTVFAASEKLNAPREKLLRALTLSNLITFYIKSYTGTLSAMCGCGVAAGIGACAGVTYLLDGSFQDILNSMINMVGTISGMICDGGKEGCAYKLALSAGWAVEASLLAMHGATINTTDGILASSFENVIRNMGHVCNPGMVDTNKAIID